MEYTLNLSEITPYADLFWLPIAFFIAHRSQRFIVLGFLAASMVMMRLLVELMVSIGYPRGILGLWDLGVSLRALGVYSFFYALYLLVAFFSPGSFKVVLLGASITIFFMTALVAVIAMVL